MHSFLDYPIKKRISLFPHLSLFLGSGICCVLEQQFYHITGRKVRGWLGRIWMWSCLIVVAWAWSANEWHSGWAAEMRNQSRARPQEHLLCWILYGLGITDHPTKWNLE